MEGSKEFNDQLTIDRRNVIEEFFKSRTGLPSEIIVYDDKGIDWNDLRNRILLSDLPEAQKILDIIDRGEIITVYYNDLNIDERILQLHALNKGKTWKILEEDFFPEMRYAGATFKFHENIQPQTARQTTESSATVAPQAPQPELTETEETDIISVEPEEEDTGCRDQRWALKSNLIYDACLMPNLELEYKINDRWSVAVEGNLAWWSNNHKHKYYQIMTITPEVRLHLNPSKNWRGSYVGLFAGGGKYDLENGGRGYQGEGGMLGLSYNYMFPVSKYISFEAGLGLGVMYTKYKEYLPIDGHYVYQKTSRLWYGGPLKLKFAFVWRFGNYKCK